MALVIGNNQGVATLMWNYITLTRALSVTIGFNDIGIANNPNSLAASIRTACVATGSIAVAGNMSTHWQFTGVKVLYRNSAGLLQNGTSLVTTTGTGAAPTNDQPIFAPLVVTKITSFAGKKFRGRMYPPATLLDEASVDAGGSIGAGAVTGLQTIWNTFYTQLIAGSVPPMLMHESSTPGLSSATPIDSFLVRGVCGVQRRRRTRGA